MNRCLQGDEIPVAELPHPFNRSKPSEIATSEPRAITDLQFAESPSISSPLHQPVVLSHMSQSFRKRFSQKKDALPDSCTTSFACIRSASQRDDPPVSLLPSSKQSVPKPPVITKSLQSSPISMKKVEGTPAKVVSTPIRLMTATPDLQTPKRCYTDKGFDSPQLKKVPKRSARTKLFNTPTKNVEAREEDEENRSSSNEDHDDILGFLPKTLLQSVSALLLRNILFVLGSYLWASLPTLDLCFIHDDFDNGMIWVGFGNTLITFSLLVSVTSCLMLTTSRLFSSFRLQ